MHKLLSIFESILFWAVITLILFIPLYMKFPLFGVSGTFVSIRMEDILIAATYLLWAVYLLLSGEFKSLFKDRLNQALLVFFFIGSVSLFSSIFLVKTVTAGLGLLHLARRVEIMMLMPLLVSVIKTKRQAFFYIGTLSVAVFLVNLYALGQRFLQFPAVSTTNSELSKGVVYYIRPLDRVISTFGGHYDLAVFLLMALSITTALIFYLYKKNKLYTLWASILAVASSVVLIMTAARLSFAAAVFGIALAIILAGKKKYLLVIAALVVVALAFPSQLRDRFVSTFTINVKGVIQNLFSDQEKTQTKLNIPTVPLTWTERSTKNASEAAEQEIVSPDIVPGEPTLASDLGVYRSFEIRIRAEWPRALRAFYKNPLLGTGYSSLGLATDNDILRSLGEVGILGTIAFFLVIYEVVKRIITIYKSQSGFVKYFSAGVLAMIFAFIVNSFLIDVFEASKTASLFWMILGISLALGKLSTKKNG